MTWDAVKLWEHLPVAWQVRIYDHAPRVARHLESIIPGHLFDHCRRSL